MPLTRYNKLVRDKILDITEASGKACTTEVLSEDEYLRMIDVKLDEELAEYHKTPNLEELADLLEVLRAAVIARGHTLDEFELVRAEKMVRRDPARHRGVCQARAGLCGHPDSRGDLHLQQDGPARFLRLISLGQARPVRAGPAASTEFWIREAVSI